MMNAKRLRALWRDGESFGLILALFLVAGFMLLEDLFPVLTWDWKAPTWVRAIGLLLLLLVMAMMWRQREETIDAILKGY